MSRTLRAALVGMLLGSAPLVAHDVERTRVSLTFTADGSFVLDVSNDPRWLALRLESIPGPFIDRIVLFVDGHEVRPTSVEYLPPPASDPTEIPTETAVATYRLRGKMPIDARTLRWYYGLVIDPYPLTVRRADGRIVVEEIAAGAWSREIDLRGQFARSSYWPVALVGMLLAAGIVLRVATLGRDRTAGSRESRVDSTESIVRSR